MWRLIARFEEAQWAERWSNPQDSMHKFHWAHNRLWRIANDICDEYNGDAGRIFTHVPGALPDCGLVNGVMDVKGDVHVGRVLGRALAGKPVDGYSAVRLARKLYPANPWLLDEPIWRAGKDHCRPANPDCAACFLERDCRYAGEQRTTGIAAS